MSNWALSAGRGSSASGSDAGCGGRLATRRASEGKGIAGPSGVSQRDVSQLLSKTKDQEVICGQLMTYAKNVEEQLRVLKAEHQILRAETQALRRCLDKKGLLAQDELESEMHHAPHANYNSGGGSLPSNSVHVHSSQSVSPSMATTFESASTWNASGSLSTGSLAASRSTGGSPHLGGDASSSLRCGRALAPSPRIGQPRGRSADVQRSTPLPDTGASLRGASAHAELGKASASGAQVGAGPSGFSSRRDLERLETMPEDACTSPERRAHEFYELVQQLLGEQNSAVDQQRILLNIQRVLKNGPVAPLPGHGSPLGVAVKSGRVDLARVLLLAKANANERDDKGVSPLHLATFDGNVSLCRVLLVARAEVDSRDRHGQTPLFFSPSREVCKLLCEKRADITILNHKGQSALHLAGRAGLHEVLTWLSLRVDKAFLDLKDTRGTTARNYAVQAETRSLDSGGTPASESFGPLVATQGVRKARDDVGQQPTPSTAALAQPHVALSSRSLPETEMAGTQDVPPREYPRVPRIDLASATKANRESFGSKAAGRESPQPGPRWRQNVTGTGRRSPQRDRPDGAIEGQSGAPAASGVRRNFVAERAAVERAVAAEQYYAPQAQSHHQIHHSVASSGAAARGMRPSSSSSPQDSAFRSGSCDMPEAVEVGCSGSKPSSPLSGGGDSPPGSQAPARRNPFGGYKPTVDSPGVSGFPAEQSPPASVPPDVLESAALLATAAVTATAAQLDGALQQRLIGADRNRNEERADETARDQPEKPQSIFDLEEAW